MIRVNIHEAKTHLSRYVERVEEGETVVLCRRNVPVVEMRRVRASRRERPPLGPDPEGFRVPDSFFEPLPADVLDTFSGRVS